MKEWSSHYPRNDQVLDFLTYTAWKEKYWTQPEIFLKKGLDFTFLKQVLSLPNEVGIYKTKKYGEWCAFPGTEEGLVTTRVPEDIVVFIHSHVAVSETPDLPSHFDLINCKDEAKNFILSRSGLTFFTLPSHFMLQLDSEDSSCDRQKLKRLKKSKRSAIILEEAKKMKEKLQAEGRNVESLGRNFWIELLGEMGVFWKVIPWEELTEARLQEIFE